MMPSTESVERANKLRIILSLGLIVFMFVAYFLLISPKRFFPHNLVIPDGASLQVVSKILKEEDLISSRSMFNIIVTLQGESKNIKSGTYVIKEKKNIFNLIERLTNGVFGQDIVTITIKEGHTLEDISNIVSSRLDNFDKELFLETTTEGYLFPDTYKFLEYTTTKEFIERLEYKHGEVVDELKQKYPENEKDINDIVIAASVIEKEADTPEGRRMVSDIIWSRIEMDMPLQVDATFVYGIGKGTFDLTIEDLTTDGEYNTYINKGLPPTAISNPGRDSLEAAFDPIINEYVFFLTGRDGEMYYAVTYEEHLDNKRRFLD